MRHSLVKKLNHYLCRYPAQTQTQLAAARIVNDLE